MNKEENIDTMTTIELDDIIEHPESLTLNENRETGEISNSSNSDIFNSNSSDSTFSGDSLEGEEYDEKAFDEALKGLVDPETNLIAFNRDGKKKPYFGNMNLFLKDDTNKPLIFIGPDCKKKKIYFFF